MGSGGGSNAKSDEHGASGHGDKMNMAEAGGREAASKAGTNHSKMAMASPGEKMPGTAQKSGDGMDMSMASAPKPQSLYSVGGEGFFLDQPQLVLTTEQIQRLGQIRERTMQGQSAAQQKIRQAEEVLWKETSAAKPVQPAIATQVREIERMRADMRLALILAVSEAVDVLTAEQRKRVPADHAKSATPASSGQPASTAPAHKAH